MNSKSRRFPKRKQREREYQICNLLKVRSYDTYTSLTKGLNFSSKGSPKPAWATTPFSSPSPKKLALLIPLVLSMTWEGTTKSFGLISSLKEPTAEKAKIPLTPRYFRAEMFARDGTEDGVIEWDLPWRARKATWTPLEVFPIEIGEDGGPHGWRWRKR